MFVRSLFHGPGGGGRFYANRRNHGNAADGESVTIESAPRRLHNTPRNPPPPPLANRHLFRIKNGRSFPLLFSFLRSDAIFLSGGKVLPRFGRREPRLFTTLAKYKRPASQHRKTRAAAMTSQKHTNSVVAAAAATAGRTLHPFKQTKKRFRSVVAVTSAPSTFTPYRRASVPRGPPG